MSKVSVGSTDRSTEQKAENLTVPTTEQAVVGQRVQTIEQTDSWLNLPSLSLSLRTLFTGYLLITGLDLFMAGAQIFLTHSMADGKFGIAIDDIVYSYYSDRGNSRLEAKLLSAH